METNSATLNTVCSVVNTDYFLKNYKNPLNPEWIKKSSTLAMAFKHDEEEGVKKDINISIDNINLINLLRKEDKPLNIVIYDSFGYLNKPIIDLIYYNIDALESLNIIKRKENNSEKIYLVDKKVSEQFKFKNVIHTQNNFTLNYCVVNSEEKINTKNINNNYILLSFNFWQYYFYFINNTFYK
ncbi:MAG: hypothetical protein M1538_03105 [Candidatus Marsarchaeota archaeon]|nr:hypothetical protein [Candidatus Marsarchaeota archaeon]